MRHILQDQRVEIALNPKTSAGGRNTHRNKTETTLQPGSEHERPDCPAGHPRDEKETAIVTAARRMFLANGFDSTSMDAIAASANVSKRTVYNRFRSKEDLFAAAILQTCQNLLPLNLEEIEQSVSVRDLLMELSRRFVYGIFDEEALALYRIAAFEASRIPALGRAYLDNGPILMARACVPIIERIAKRSGVEIANPLRAIYHLGGLLTEPYYTKLLMGFPREDVEAIIEDHINAGIDAFLKIYDIPASVSFTD